MNKDISDLSTRLKNMARPFEGGHMAKTIIEAADALEAADARITSLESQLTAKTELATLYAASLRKVEGDAERLAWWLRFDPPKDNDFINVYLKGMAERWNLDQWRAAIDTARVQGKEGA